MAQIKPPEAWEQEFVRLSYEWEKVYAYGDAASMCTDGVILNQIRQELMKIKEKLEAVGTDSGLPIPPETQRDFMACAEEIRTRAQSAVQEYLALEEYRYIQAVLPKLTPKQKRDTCVLEVSGKVTGLADALAEDNLVVLREYGTPGMLSRLIMETAKKLRGLSFKALPVPEKEQEKAGEDWQVEGQMSIYDLAI
jgi:hypothetical protein